MGELQPRHYQLEIFNQCLEKNSIIYLPTGSGKTFIAVLLIKHFSAHLKKPYENGGKRAIFLVNAIQLGNQQCAYLNRHTGLRCKGFFGTMDVDQWSNKRWKEEISQNEVLVMTSQIFLNILNEGVISMKRCSIVFFDECHRAVKDQPMRQITNHLTNVPILEQPRIIGLSATLINSNIEISKVEETLQELEKTFDAKIVAVDDKNEVINFATSPKEKVIYYDQTEDQPVMKKVFTVLENVKNYLINVQLEKLENRDLIGSRNVKSKLINIILDIEENYKELGLYGFDKTILIHMQEIDKMKINIDSIAIASVFNYMISNFLYIRAILNDEMKNFTEQTRIFKFSSKKILTVIQELKNFNTQKKDGQKFCCIIFAQRRVTVNIIYQILSILHENNQAFTFLKPGFVIGENNNVFKAERQNRSMSQWNKEILEQFRNKSINCLVSTDVIDEGVDVPVCTLIVRFHFPQDFRAYVQSKGRARHSLSEFVLLIDESDCEDALQKYYKYRRIGNELEKLLIGQTKERKTPNSSDVEWERYEVYDKKSDTTSFIDEQSAIPLIMKYCASLYKSKYVFLKPIWTKKSSGSLYQVSLKLPSLSPLNKQIIGDERMSIDSSKRSAAFKTCIELHKKGELNDRLQPKTKEDILMSSEFLRMFPNWKEENLKEENPKRIYEMERIECLYNAYPVSNKTLYLHVLDVRTEFFKPSDNFYKEKVTVFYDILSAENGFAILSSKPMPVLPQFPIFMSVGELSVNVHINNSTLQLSDEQIEKLRLFHTLIFKEIVSVIKEFMIFDKKHMENSFLIVPVNSQWKINWNVVNDHQVFHYDDLTGYDDYSDLKLSLIRKKYAFEKYLYLTVDIRPDIKAWSPFVDPQYGTFYNYYSEKHGLNIKHIDKPFLEVMCLNKTVDFHKPTDKKLSNSTEILIPEFCEKLNFPTSYFIKTATLPTILYRITHLLVADQLRRKIAEDISIGSVEVCKTSHWEPLISEEKDDLLSDSCSNISVATSFYDKWNIVSPAKAGSNFQLCNFQENFNFMEEDSDEDYKMDNLFCDYKTVDDTVVVPNLDFYKFSSTGPQLVSIAKALTSTQASDIINLERLENLGDAFLKFATCLYLLENFPNLNEGTLTLIKGKIVGNRNLYYCGEAKTIPGMIKNQRFNNGISPSYSICRYLQEAILKKKVSHNILHEIHMSSDEMKNGQVKLDNYLKIRQLIDNYTTERYHSNMEHYLSLQVINDKNVSDAVEALIGAYLQDCGVEAAVKVIQWFQVLPQFSIKEVFFSVKNKAQDELQLYQINPMANTVEKNIGYKFKNNANLLEALTHASFLSNDKNNCYERLEFLGDSILDFLITKYIFETCTSLSPGELTDVRSSLVNNGIFACLAVRYGLHTLLLSLSPTLQLEIDKFVKYQNDQNHIVDTKYIKILSEHNNMNLAESVNAPKVLGDIFESLIGAIYIDCGKDLYTVWSIVYKLMHQEIEQFKVQTPKQSVRLLLEMTHLQPRFSKTFKVEDTGTVRVYVCVLINGKRHKFNGFAANKKLAKNAAAQHALDYIERNKL